MRPIVPDLLWIGNVHDVRDISGTLSLGVRAIVDLAANEPPTLYPRDMVCCRLPLSDGAENDPAILRLAVMSTAELIRSRVPTLVGCSAGMSRSPAIVAAALALVEGKSPDAMLLRVAATGPHAVHPALWADVKRIVLSLGQDSEIAAIGTSLALLVLKTRQMENLRAFYQAIGVELAEEQHGKGPIHLAGKLGDAVFEIYPATDAASVDSTTRLGISLASLAEVVEILRSTGAPVVSESKSTPWGTRAVVRDPYGRAVELYQR